MSVHEWSIIIASDEWQFSCLVGDLYTGNTTNRIEFLGSLKGLSIKGPFSILVICSLFFGQYLVIAVHNSLVLFIIWVIDSVLVPEVMDYIFPWIVIGTFCQSQLASNNYQTLFCSAKQNSDSALILSELNCSIIIASHYWGEDIVFFSSLEIVNSRNI